MNRFDKLIRPHLKDLIPYSSARNEYRGKEGIFLDANENSMGSVGGDKWNRYPDPYQEELKEKVAKLKSVRDLQIFVGNGSDEPIDLLIRAFCEPGKDKILITSPTYGMYRVSAGIHNVKITDVPLTDNFQLKTKEIIEKTSEVKITFLCSPNNPTGNLLSKESILEVIESSAGLVVVDEAYIDFSPENSVIRYIEKYANLVVLQTFSKAWGLAGFRAGMAFGHPELIKILNRIKPPYNISGPIQKMLIEALEKVRQKDQWVNEILKERKVLEDQLNTLKSVLNVYPSDANFLLVKFRDSSSIFKYLQSQKIIVRDRSAVILCQGCLRITVGTPEENVRLVNTLKKYEQ